MANLSLVFAVATFSEYHMGKGVTDPSVSELNMTIVGANDTWNTATQIIGTEAFDAALEDLRIVNVRKITTGIAIPALYFFLFLFGFVGNAVVIYVSFFLTRKSKNAVDIFVGNLAVADLALIATLPFWAVSNLLDGIWIFGDAGCKIMSFLTHINMFSSIFLITAMAVDRYTVVVKAVKVRAKSLRTVSRTLCSCGVIWTFSVILSLPSAILRQEKSMRNKTRCHWVYPKNSSEVWWGLHIVTRNFIGFVIPLAIICRCYCVIISYIRSRSNSRPTASGRNSNGDDVKEKQSRRVTRLVTAIILAFVICWLPNQVSIFCHSLIHFKVLPTPQSRYGQEVVYLIHVFTTILSFCNSVANPVIYSTSPSHRMHIKMIFFRVFRCFRSSSECKDTYAEYKSAKKCQKPIQVKTPAPSATQGQKDRKADRRCTEVTRLPLMNGQDSPKTSTERLNFPNYSAAERRDSPRLLCSSLTRLPTGVEEEEVRASAPMIVVEDIASAKSASASDSPNRRTLLLSERTERNNNNDNVQQQYATIKKIADDGAEETLL